MAQSARPSARHIDRRRAAPSRLGALRRWARRHRVLSIGGAVVAVGGAIAGVGQWVAPEMFASEASTTTVTIFTAGSSSDQPDEDVELICANSSLVSLRRDTQACLLGHTLLDPCFDYGEGIVTCPSHRYDSGQWQMVDNLYQVSEVVEFHFDPAIVEHQVGADTATHTTAPWAVELDVNRNGHPVLCTWISADIPTPDVDTARYDCIGVPPIVASPAGFADGSDVTIWWYAGPEATPASSAFGLDATKDVWAIQYAETPAEGFRNVHVSRAWY